jgi:predicted RNA-binding protein with PIN domain
MARDGNIKKPKKKAALTAATASSSPAPAPRRVTNSINVPIRHQIMMAQLHKEMQRSAASSSSSSSSSSSKKRRVERTSYRRAIDEDEAAAKAEERKRRGQEPDWDVILSSHRNATTTTGPLVIVDGYNIIHKWSRLQKHMAKGDPSRARRLLVDDLENLSSLKGWRIEVVFDGAGRRPSSAEASAAAAAAASSNAAPSAPVSDAKSYAVAAQGRRTGGATVLRAEQGSHREVSKHGVRVVYTGAGVEADAYIESRCAAAKGVTSGKFTGSFIVATDDQMVRMAGANAGAMCMGADRFVTELKAVKGAVSYRVEAAVAAANGRAILPGRLRGVPDRRFGRGSVLLEDKRKLREEAKKRSRKEHIPDIDVNIKVEVDENGIPWWAKVPNQSHLYK